MSESPDLRQLPPEKRAEIARQRFKIATTEAALEWKTGQQAVRNKMGTLTVAAFTTGLLCGMFPSLGRAVWKGVLTAAQLGGTLAQTGALEARRSRQRRRS